METNRAAEVQSATDRNKRRIEVAPVLRQSAAMLQEIANRFVLGACLCAATLFLLAGCASDDDGITGKQDPAAEGAAAVPGAATPAPNAHSAGWW